MRQLLHHARRDQRVIPRTPNPLRHELEAFDETTEDSESPCRIHGIPAHARVQHHHRFAIHRTFQMQVYLGKAHIIKVPMTAAEMEAIIGGYHGDAFSVLGPHPINASSPSSWIVRAFLPQARSASVLSGKAALPMEKAGADGFYT